MSVSNVDPLQVDNVWQLLAILVLSGGWTLREMASRKKNGNGNGNGASNEKMREVARDVCVAIASGHEANCRNAADMLRAMGEMRSEMHALNKAQQEENRAFNKAQQEEMRAFRKAQQDEMRSMGTNIIKIWEHLAKDGKKGKESD
jgi:Mg2+ and Co2+ transporter CorA